jgi:hypothetical protein
MERLLTVYTKYNLRNRLCYVACLSFIIFAVLSLPQVGMILPSSQTYFHFRLNQHNSLDNSTDIVGDAYVTASSKGIMHQL